MQKKLDHQSFKTQTTYEVSIESPAATSFYHDVNIKEISLMNELVSRYQIRPTYLWFIDQYYILWSETRKSGYKFINYHAFNL